MRIGSLRLRLLAGAVAFILAALAIAAVGLSVLFERHVKTWIDSELEGQIERLVAGLEPDASGNLRIETPPADPRFDTPFAGRYWQIVMDGGKETLRSRSLWDFVIALPPQTGVDGHTHHHRVAGPKGHSLYLIERRIELPARLGRKTGRVVVGLDEAEVDGAVWSFTTALIPLLALLGALLAAAAWIQVSLGLRPLSRIRDHIAFIRSGTANRLGNDFPEEVRPLSEEIDKLLDARERQLETARSRAADLAHGLKTPIQVLLGGISKLKAKGETEIAGDLESAASLMQRHVERQLARARVSAGNGEISANAAAVAERIVRVVRKTPRASGKDWSVSIPAAVQVRIHPDDLAEALGGLVENAARHARTRIVVSAIEDQGLATIAVSDDGPGIPEDQYEEALGRGRRLDTSGPGSGLGLAIAADIAEAWGGQITFARHDGLFSVNLRLPKASPR